MNELLHVNGIPYTDHWHAILAAVRHPDSQGKQQVGHGNVCVAITNRRMQTIELRLHIDNPLLREDKSQHRPLPHHLRSDLQAKLTRQSDAAYPRTRKRWEVICRKW